MQVVEFSSRWDLMPIRALVTYYAVSNVDKALRDGETPVRLCNYSDVYNNEFISPQMDHMQATASDNEIERFSLSKNDIIITKDSESWEDIGVPALVIESSSDLVCGYHLALLRPNSKMILGAFLLRCLQARPVQVQLELAANGITRFGVPKSAIGATLVPVPPIGEQRAIVDYLDRETARLDKLVAETSGLLELLSEKRSALIASVITGKKSVGSQSKSHDNIERSQDWPTKRLRFLVKTITSDDRTPPSWVDEIAFLAMDAIGTHGSLDLSVTRRIDDVRSGYTKLANGDVVVAKITPCFENGKGALIQGMAGGVGFGTTELHVLKPGPDLDGRYLYYVTVDPRFRKLGEEWMFGAAGQQRVPEDFVRDYRVAVPPLSQQRAIAEYLDRETTRLDSLVAETSGLLNLLSEKRSALIASVITGRKTVGNAT